MNDKIQFDYLFKFKDYLVENKYSELVIKMYLRKTGEFLKSKNLTFITDYLELKEAISMYLPTLPISSQKSMIQAALHIYYYFISGNQFLKRNYTEDFATNPIIDAEIDRFRKYLNDVARLSSTTTICHCNTVKAFLYSCHQESGFLTEKINANIIRSYFSNTVKHLSAISKKTIICRIRSYIRFLEFADGFNSDEILKLPMTSPVWNKAGIPKYLKHSEIQRLLSTYDLTTPIGIRNYGIVRCLKDLGLRCSEVAGLSIDDIDWSQGIVTIKKTKSHAERTLPLHPMTGQALEKYLLNSRPITEERIIFVRFKNKKGYPMGTSQVRNTVRTASIRAKLENFSGPHMLRHTAAIEMINNGIDLKTIADILGHESVETTCIYTKLDFSQLIDVAAKWPEVRV